METEREKRNKLPLVIALVLLAGVAGIAWVALPLMTKPDAPNLYPAAQAAPPAPDALGSRMKAAEEKLTAWAKDRGGLSERMGQIEKSLTSGIRRARSETTALVEGIKRDMGRSLEAIQTRLNGIESVQREAHGEVARLQDELASVRRELTSMREAGAQQSNQVNQIDQAQQGTQQEVSGLQSQAMSNQRRVDALSYQVERDNVSFEVSKDRTQEVIPGIYLTIKHTDVARQQIDGWLQIASDGRFVWLKDAGAQNPIAFASRNDERAYQLVFTRIAEVTAAGYVLVPAAPVKTETAAK